mmetsp:Transcript_16975/g.59437  ORF Transcript_16975/g.59437 Transcript_16975/m.59437 type:complete len:267 (+) Transcript_16975:82-882(+)
MADNSPVATCSTTTLMAMMPMKACVREKCSLRPAKATSARGSAPDTLKRISTPCAHSHQSLCFMYRATMMPTGLATPQVRNMTAPCSSRTASDVPPSPSPQLTVPVNRSMPCLPRRSGPWYCGSLASPYAKMKSWTPTGMSRSVAASAARSGRDAVRVSVATPSTSAATAVALRQSSRPPTSASRSALKNDDHLSAQLAPVGDASFRHTVTMSASTMSLPMPSPAHTRPRPLSTMARCSVPAGVVPPATSAAACAASSKAMRQCSE